MGKTREISMDKLHYGGRLGVVLPKNRRERDRNSDLK